MRRSRTGTILHCCFFTLFVWSRHPAFAQQPPQANEKERGIELYRKGNFSEEARLAGVQGAVILMVVFADEGVLKHILVLQGLSHGLTGQVIAAARKIRFTPAMRDAKSTSVIGSLEYYFNLY